MPDLKQMKNKKTRNAQVLTYRELEIATEGFVGKNVIGFGRFGVVYKGNLEGRVVAIKMLNREGNQGEREFRVEVYFLTINSACMCVYISYIYIWRCS